MDARLLDLPEGTTALQHRKLIRRLYQRKPCKWHVKVLLRKDIRRVIRYLSASVYGGAIRNDRIVSVTTDTVAFRYRNSRNRPDLPDDDTLTYDDLLILPIEEFVRRWGETIPPPDLKTVRHWGLLAPGNRTRLNIARDLLGQEPAPPPPAENPPCDEDDQGRRPEHMTCSKCARRVYLVREHSAVAPRYDRAATAILDARAAARPPP
jgi:hypothetical protein